MANTLLQGNLNRARNAQDILAQTMAEYYIGLAVIAEPYRIPVHPHWVGDLRRDVAICWRRSSHPLPLTKASTQSYGKSPMIVAGDFNSRSTPWGDRTTNLRGRLLEDWVASLSLCCMNTRRTSTCVRATGESAVDITWASPGLARRIAK
ncbi:PREDICTED: uncharacterized protein LOC108769208 [Trachymyrmex cornetzi]|uniref:uncharacterized protein LOC108769208 n=1 Tax=Trachymyrmex cornetzi TaxID=471704 RepID=UPI00084F0D36|nr:PREDICTED: uncharacterized protein LOC108769208 [Trachymyrmex cornetzi]